MNAKNKELCFFWFKWFLPLLPIILTSTYLDAAETKPPLLDVLVRGVSVEKGYIDCQKRYEKLSEHLQKYERPFTVLDLGAKEGFYSLQIAKDFPKSVCIMTERLENYHPCKGTLIDLCRKNADLENLIYLNAKPSVSELKRLSECEHIDVALMMAPSSYLSLDKQNLPISYFEMLAAAADFVFIEVPSEASNILNVLAKMSNSVEIATLESPATKLYLVEGRSYERKRAHWYAKEDLKPLLSSFEKLSLYFTTSPTSQYRALPLIPGISLLSFKQLNGLWPTKAELERSIEWTSWDNFPNAMPWDFVICGQKTALYRHNHIPQPSPFQGEELSRKLLTTRTKRELADVLGVESESDEKEADL